MSDNELLGHWKCPGGGDAEVYQTKKRGRHFYTKCECCGLQQGTKPGRQQKIWDEAKFIDGVTRVRPSNVIDRGDNIIENTPEDSSEVSKVESEPQPKVESDFDPNESEPAQQQVSDEKPRGYSRFLIAGGIFLGSLVAGLWMG